MLTKDAIRAAVVKLDMESKNYYQSANEALFTSVGYALVSCTVFVFSSLAIPKLISKNPDFMSSLGLGGSTGGITLAWGFMQRFERRDKARQIEAQKKSLEMLSDISDLDNEADHARIAATTLELTLRTISAPYDFSRKTSERTD